MAIPTITGYTGVIPDRRTQSAEDFTSAAVTWTDYQSSTLVPSTNAAIDGINAAQDEILDSVNNAEESSFIAQAAANYQGAWFSGAQVVKGESWSHNGLMWAANVTGAGEPQENAQWFLLNSEPELSAIKVMLEQWGYRYIGLFDDGFTYSQVGDAGVDANNNAWVYTGAGAPNKVVTAGDVPSVGEGYEQVAFNSASDVTDSRGTNVQDYIDGNLTPFKTVADMKAAAFLSSLPEFTRVEWQGYYSQSDNGGNRGVLRFGTHAEDGGSVFSIDGNTYIQAIFTQEVLTSQFGTVGDNVVDDTQALRNAIKYLQNGVEVLPTETKTHSELIALTDIAYSENGRPSVLVIDGKIRHTEQIMILGGFEIESSNSKGAWGSSETSFGLYYDGPTGNRIAMSTASYLHSGDNRIPITTHTQLKALLESPLTIQQNTTNYTYKVSWKLQQSVKAGTAIGTLFGANTSKISDSRFGMLDAAANVSFVGLNVWATPIRDTHMYGSYQSIAMGDCNHSCKMEGVYCSTWGDTGVASNRAYRFEPATSEILSTGDIITTYFSRCGVQLDNFITESSGKTHHIVSDLDSSITVYGGYYETHAPAQGTVTAISCYNNSMVQSLGGFLPKSNFSGFDIYLENVDSGRPSGINTSFLGSGGYLVKTVNSDADVYINSVGVGGAGNWGRSITDNTGTTNLSKIHIQAPKPVAIDLNTAVDSIAMYAANTLDNAISLAMMHNAKEIRLLSDYSLPDDVDMDEYNSSRMYINLNGNTLDCNGFKLSFTYPKTLSEIHISNGTIITPSDYVIRSDGSFKVDAMYSYIKFKGDGAVWGNLRNLITGSNINMQNCTYENYTSEWLVGTPATTGSKDNVTLFVRGEALPATVTSPIKNMPNGNYYYES